MSAIQQNRCLSFRRRKLQSPRRCLIRNFHLRDNTGQRPVAKTVFGQRQDVGILATLSVQDLGGAQPGLFQARRIEIEPGERP